MILISTQCFPPDRGGIEILMGGLADALAASGKDVAVFADDAHETGPEIKAPYPIHRFGGFKPLRRRRKAWAIAKAVKRGGVEAIFADSWKSIERLPKLNVAIVVLAHGMEFPPNPTSGKQGRIVRALAKATRVVANSAYTASQAKPYVANSETRLRVINPPIGPQDEPTAGELGDLRAVIAGRSPVLLTLARLEPRKGIDMVIRALPDILKTHPNAVYIVAGGGEDRPRLEKLVVDSGVGRHVHFAGAVDGPAKAALFSVADVFLMPARREGNSVEGFGIVYLEAAWYGVPSLAGREGGAVDAVRDGETGLLCNGDDLADVRRQILRLLDDAALKKKLSAGASARAKGPAQWTNAVRDFLAAL
ncbi:MAG: glycosyltransferase family 4 protein [Alphaproteobacteria bacterium]|jgi:phosphatidylinositol alpha-1,6-mannosyltransferase|nr:glycosyltransferase family 4 protein [Alphaproteobacteria bacterium]